MTRREFLGSVAGGMAGLALAGKGFGMADEANRRPNFVFILVDDLGWSDLGCFGSTFYETPHCDRLAAEGMRFTNAYAACPVCSPTRASILAGKYPARMATTDWFGAPQPDSVGTHWTKDKPLLPAPYVEQLPLEEVTVAEALKEGGYRTFFAGKWHLGGEGFFPEDQGFEVNRGDITGAARRGGISHRTRIRSLKTAPRANTCPNAWRRRRSGSSRRIATSRFSRIYRFIRCIPRFRRGRIWKRNTPVRRHPSTRPFPAGGRKASARCGWCRIMRCTRG